MTATTTTPTPLLDRALSIRTPVAPVRTPLADRCTPKEG